MGRARNVAAEWASLRYIAVVVKSDTVAFVTVEDLNALHVRLQADEVTHHEQARRRRSYIRWEKANLRWCHRL